MARIMVTSSLKSDNLLEARMVATKIKNLILAIEFKMLGKKNMKAQVKVLLGL